MRMSGFLVGGLVGAAAVMYFSKKRPGMMAWASSAITDIGSKAAASPLTGMTKNSWKNQANSAASKLSNQSEDKEANWEQIEAIINSDPEIKKEADKIKADTATVTH